MNKADLLTQIESTTKGIAKVEPVLAGAQPEVIAMQNGRTAQKYTVNVAIAEGETVTFRNIPIVVFDEGLATEEAMLSQGAEAPKLKDFETRAQTYLDKRVADGVFLSYQVVELNETFKYVVASVIENVAGTMTRKKVLVYKQSGTPIEHRPFVE